MALQAPFHLQRSVLPHQRHSIHRPVTRSATHALADMNAVIEVNVVGQIVDAGPHDGFAGAEALAHRLKRRAAGPDLRMAIHAGLGRWNIGERRTLHRRVAIAAIDSQASHVMLMAKGNGLLDRSFGARRVIGMIELGKSPSEKS